MFQFFAFERVELTWPWRLVFFVLGAGLIGLLVTAALLSADPRGFGTHEQLGLYPCSAQFLLGFRCPACGMTTSWTRLLHGDVLGALAANVGGTLLAVVSIVGGPWMVASAIAGRWVGPAPRDLTLALVLTGVLVVTFVEWGFRLL